VKVDKFLLATMNKKSVIDTIRTKGPINKSEIARLTDLSIPTVMKLSDEFIKSGLVRINGKRESSGGKRPELLEFIPDAYCIIGVDIGKVNITVIIMNLSGKIITRQIQKTGDTIPAEAMIDRLIHLIELTIESSQVDKSKILGMGIGMPGLLDAESGEVLFSPDFHWEKVNLVRGIKNYFNINIQLENSNRALAMGENWFGVGINASNFICVNLGHGIGSAIVQEGEFYRGSCGSSGELGHITLKKDGPICDCGNKGCLEALASGNAIAYIARDRIQKGESSMILKLAEDKLENIDAKMVFDAAKLKDPLAIQIIEEAIEYIGIGLASYINLLDPDMIILAGGLVNAGDILVERIKKVAKARQMKFAGRKVKIRVAKLGSDATAIGAASLILKSFLESGGNPEF